MMRTIIKYTILSFILFIGCDIDKSPLSNNDNVVPMQLTSSGHDCESFWSPDGNHIAFLTSKNTFNPLASGVFFELWVMNKDGSNQRPLFNRDALPGETIHVKSVTWCLDSYNIVIEINISQRSEIWRVDLDNNKIRLTSINEKAFHPICAPNLTQIAFLIRGTTLFYNSYWIDTNFLYISNLNGSEKKLLVDGPVEIFAWKNDSKSIIYSQYDLKNENFEIWEASIDGLSKKQISNSIESEYEPSFSFDGNHIAFHANHSVFITSSNNFQPKLLLEGAVRPRWIPNKNLLYVINEEEKGGGYFWARASIVNMEGKIIKTLNPDHVQNVDFSPDGKYLVYAKNGNLWMEKF